MKALLILFTYILVPGAASSQYTFHEFSSMEVCERAGEAAANLSSSERTRWTCVEIPSGARQDSQEDR